MNDDIPDHEAIMEWLNSMPRAQRHNATLKLIAGALDTMPAESIISVLAEIKADPILSEAGDLPIVREAINLIEGNLALREMGFKY